MYKSLTKKEAIELLHTTEWLPEGYILFKGKYINAQLRAVDKAAGLRMFYVSYVDPSKISNDDDPESTYRPEESWESSFFIKNV